MTFSLAKPRLKKCLPQNRTDVWGCAFPLRTPLPSLSQQQQSASTATLPGLRDVTETRKESDTAERAGGVLRRRRSATRAKEPNKPNKDTGANSTESPTCQQPHRPVLRSPNAQKPPAAGSRKEPTIANPDKPHYGFVGGHIDHWHVEGDSVMLGSGFEMAARG